MVKEFEKCPFCRSLQSHNLYGGFTTKIPVKIVKSRSGLLEIEFVQQVKDSHAHQCFVKNQFLFYYIFSKIGG
jgi:hypothetical protein